jgi:oligopeptide transport system substrate-binding protein
MTRRGRAWSLTASAAAAALLVSACGGGGSDADDSGGSGGSGDAAQGGSFNYNLTEPTFLAPAQRCYESECIAVLSVIQEPLLNVDLETGEPVYDGVAESIESDDATTWTVKLKDGYTFHNGEEVNADAYIRAWNWSADPENGAETAGFMSKIEGAGEGGEMSGLTKIDDLTFEVKLTAPFSAFPQQMSYTPGFAPIAQECLDDLEACNEQPIGTGPYMMDGPWDHDNNITVTRYEDYAGENPGNADTISFDMYTDAVAAFRAWQGGTLDIMNGVDPTVYASAKSEAGDRMFEEESSSFNYLGLPIKADGYSNVDVRHALSMAVNRQEIVDGVLNGLHTPAKDVVSPAVPGSRDDACQYCDFEPDEAKQLFDDAGGLPGNTANLWFNAGSGHDAWVEAIGNGWKQTLGIDFTLESREWAQYLELRSEGAFDGPYRLSWIMDYPSAENYLRPMYGSNGDVNYYGYANKTVDQALDKADAASTPEKSIEYFQQAGDQVLEDMPVIPLWFGKAVAVWSENVDNVSYSVTDANVDLRSVTVVGS